MARLALVGLPGAGKTTVARALAFAWGCCVSDTDDVLAERVGVPAARYLRENGEVVFREVELDALARALAGDCVVATGAGVVTLDAARVLLGHEVTLWLDADDDTLLARVADGDRPLLGDDHRAALAALRAAREEWYRACSRERVDTSGALVDVVRRVRELAEAMAS